MIHATCGFNDGALMAISVPPEHAAHAHRFCPAPTRAAHILPSSGGPCQKFGSFEFRGRPMSPAGPLCALAGKWMARGGIGRCGVQRRKEVGRLDGFRRGKLRFPQMAQIVEDTNGTLFPDNGVIDAAILLITWPKWTIWQEQAAWGRQ